MFEFEFTQDQIEEFLDGNREADEWYSLMVELFPKYGITTKNRVAGFISQCAHESRNFTVMEENLNYSEDALERVFWKYFGSRRNAANYAYKPEKIANVVYANRLGNGNTRSGDGWKFRGHGVIQLTGRYNHSQFGEYVGIHDEDELLEYLKTKRGALEAACWYWETRGLNDPADRRDIVRMTELINGGHNGLSDREDYFWKAIDILGDEGTESVDETPEPQARYYNIGSRGDFVGFIQKVTGAKVDNYFGPNTKRAVKFFQRRKGLTVDGVVGPKTIEAMKEYANENF